MEWITIKEAVIRTGKGERTIHRWIDSNKLKPYFVKKDRKLTMLNASEIEKDYPFSDVRHKSENVSQDNKTNQMQIVSHSETIKELSEHIKQKDKQLEYLLTKKSKTSLWLTLGFTVGLSTLLAALYMGFTSYREELINNSNRQFKEANELYSTNLEKIEAINLEHKKTITQQRQELAKKNRLISQLYDDTKAQNKKLLELTESLKNEVIKNEQKENNLPTKEAQN